MKILNIKILNIKLSFAISLLFALIGIGSAGARDNDKS